MAEKELSFCKQVRIVECNPFVRSRSEQLGRFISLQPIVDKPLSEMAALVNQTLEQNDFYVIVCSTTVMATYISGIGRLPKVIDIDNSLLRANEFRVARATSFPAWIAARISQRKRVGYDRAHLPRFELCTVTSSLDKEVTRRYVGERPRIEVIPNGVDTDYLRPANTERKGSTLIYTGSLTYDVNYEAIQYFLRDIYPAIKSKVADVELVITGSYEGVDLTGLDLDKSVCLTGFVADIRKYVQEAAVAIAPILSGGGTRIKVLEAMALGTPIVATSRAAEGLPLEDGVNILIAEDEQAFVDAVVRLLNQPELAGEIATAARELVEQQFDWSGLESQFALLIESVAASARDVAN
jgi:glycosyltransferase involved in cell wall biosynthesis